MASFWQGKRVLVTGGAGFIGSAVVEALTRCGVDRASIAAPRSRDFDLRELANCRAVMSGCHVVIHLAAPTGGIAYSGSHPASQYRDSTLINLHTLEAARLEGVEKVVCLGNLFAYPAAAPAPLREDQLHAGPIAATHLGLGLMKRDLVDLAIMYHRQYGLSVVNVLAANAYGPHDRFDAAAGHVIPATIMKCMRDEDLVVWGDGTSTRDFLYVDDVADGLLLAAERLDAPGYVNIASGREVSIAELVRLIASLAGFRRRIIFDATKGGDSTRRVADTSKGRQLGFAPKVSLEGGLGRTIHWFAKRQGMALSP